MPYIKNCNLYYETPNYLVGYRGNFKEEIDKVPYACGDVITNSIGVISTSITDLNQLFRDVPSLSFIDFRRRFVLQDTSPSNVDNINAIKINPYLDLNGQGVLIGILDTGIDYLNEEFIREDDTSRILSIWDQTIRDTSDQSVYLGKTFSNEVINSAINAYRNNQNPYDIVPTRDENGHGTQIAGIIGARGYNQELQGVAPGCEFVVVKLLEAVDFRNELVANGLEPIPIYSNAEILTAIDYLKNFAITAGRPMVICLSVGTTQGSHDGNDLLSRYISSVGTNLGIVTVMGTGNEGASDGHTSGTIQQVGGIASIELRIPREIKSFGFNILVVKPNVASLNVISPSGESSTFIKAIAGEVQNVSFVFLKTSMTVRYYLPEQFTGHEVIAISFNSIKAGIWTFQLRGDYITNGIFHIWLPPQKTLPENTRFLQSDPYTTLTIPSTATKVLSVGYYGNDNALVAASGRGPNLNANINNPDISTLGVEIITTKPLGGITTISGSSAATGIIAGACALLLQWGIVKGNDKTMFAPKILAYLIHGADRSNLTYRYPNREIGYGFFDLLGTFNIISRSYRTDTNSKIDNSTSEYFVNKLFIRIPNKIWGR